MIRFIPSLSFILLWSLWSPCFALSSGMVVTSQHLATKVGQEILNQGGNAIDAAVAVGYALSVVEPCCGNIGGGGFMLIHKKNNENIVINFREKAPLSVNLQAYKDETGQLNLNKIQRGYLAVAVPGTVMGLNTALKKYGSFSLKQVMQPAIQLAEQGYVLVSEDAEKLKRSWALLKFSPNVVAIFSKNGKPLTVGDRLVQQDLARSLKKIQSEGESAFYQGSLADTIVKNSRLQGGFLSKKDFMDYTIKIEKPLTCHYHGLEILSVPPPSSGGVVLCEILQILSGYPLTQWGYHDPRSIHYTLEAMRYAYADRNQLGDPDFVSNPIDKLLSNSYAAHLRQKIHPINPGPALIDPKTAKEKQQTTHYSIVDKEGNAVAVTYTLNGNFGAKIIAGNTGFFLNNEMDDFALSDKIANQFHLMQGRGNAIQAGKRPLSSMTPTILLKNKQLFMVLGAPGGPTIPTQVLETIQNVIDFKLDINQAVNAPHFHMQSYPNLVYMEPNTFSIPLLAQLKNRGYAFKLGSPFNTDQWGSIAAILVNQNTGELTGAINHRRTAGSVLKSQK